jgi:hypothetical protein
MLTFQKGDFIVEHLGARSPASFGVVTGIHEGEVISVRFPRGEFYSFASYCRHYQDWLDEHRF